MRNCVSTLFVCITCRREGDPPAEKRPGARLYEALKEQAGDLEVVPVECLSNCTRSCSTAITGSGKWTYVVGNLDPDTNVSDILEFARLHKAHEHGLPVWRDRPEHIRRNTIARVPPVQSLGVVK